MKKVIGALVLMLLGGGCGGGDGVEGVEGDVESLGEIELALSNTSWVDAGPLPQQITLSSPVGATKKALSNGYVTWTFAADNLTNVRYSIYDKVANTNSAWTLVPGSGVLGNGLPNATSWGGCGGNGANRNIAVAWIDPSGNAKVSFSTNANATNLSATPVDLGGGNASNRPGLVWSNGKLIVITAVAGTNNFRFKWAQISCSGAIIVPWSGWINFPAKAFGGGAAAAAVNLINNVGQVAVVGVASAGCAGGLCPAWITRINVPQLSTAAPTFHDGIWRTVPSSFASFSSLGIVQRGEFGPGGAYLIARGTTDTSMRVAFTTSASTVTGAWTNITNTNCSSVVGQPSIALQEAVLPLHKYRLHAKCNPGPKVRFSTLTE